MHAFEAREILCSYYPQDSRSGSFKTSEKPDKLGATRRAWTSGNSAHDDATDRDARYLAAYIEIVRVAGKELYASGIPLDDKFVWLDRAVMHTLLKHEYLTLDESVPVFRLTEKGKRLVSSVPRPSIASLNNLGR